MTLAVREGSVQRAFRLLETDLSVALPNDVWRYILFYLSASGDLKHLTSMSMTSRAFFNSCLPSFTRLRVQNAFGCLRRFEPGTLESIQTEPIPLSEKFIARQELLCVDAQGRQYSRSIWGSYKHILCISDLRNGTFVQLNLIAKLQEAGIDKDFGPIHYEGPVPYTEQRYKGQYIVNCYPTKEGFLLVTNSGYSRWKFENDELIFQDFRSPFNPYRGNQTEIQQSAFQDGKLMIKGFGLGQGGPILSIDTENPDASFSILKYSDKLSDFCKEKKVGSFSTFLHHLDGAPCFIITEKEETSILKLQLSEGEGSNWTLDMVGDFTFKGHFDNEFLPCSSPNWTLFFDRTYTKEQLYIIKDGKIWIGEEMGIPMPAQRKNDHCCIYEDFLFINYHTGDFRLIYLPTKQDYSLKCKERLQKFLESKGATLYWLSMEYNQDNEACLHLLFQTKENDVLTLHSLKVPLKASLSLEAEPQVEEVVEDVREPDPVELNLPVPGQKKEEPKVEEDPKNPSEVPPEVQPASKQKEIKPIEIKKKPPSCVENKITLLVGIALLACVAAAGAVLVILHPGTIIYKGSGVILTLPAVLTLSIGGPAALIVIAIGSYQWWRAQ